MNDPEARVLARAARQHTVFSRRQALADGMMARQLEFRQATGRVDALFRGVYGLAGVPPSFERSVMAACLAAGGVASHRSAARLWQLRGCESGLVEVTVVRRRRPELPGVIGHRTARLDTVDVTERTGIPVTSPARTLLDLGAVIDCDQVEVALEDAVFRGLVTPGWLRRTIERLATPGRNGSATLRALVESRDGRSAATESIVEDEVVRLFRRAGLPQPRLQYSVRAGGRVLRLDVAYPDALLDIEVQGLRWHSTRVDLERDWVRHNLLLAAGWRVLYYTAHDVRRRPREVVAEVTAALDRRPAGQGPDLCGVETTRGVLPTRRVG